MSRSKTTTSHQAVLSGVHRTTNDGLVRGKAAGHGLRSLTARRLKGGPDSLRMAQIQRTPQHRGASATRRCSTVTAHNSTAHATSGGEVFSLITTVIKTKPINFMLFL